MAKRKKNVEMLTAAEALEEYGEVLAFLKWDKRMMGVYCQGSILVGKYDKTLKEWVLQRDSLERLIDFVQSSFHTARQSHRKGGG